MKTTPVLTVLRHSLRIIEWLAAIAAVLIVVSVWVLAPYALTTPGSHSVSVGPLYRFELAPAADAPLHYDAGNGSTETITLGNCEADVFLSGGSTSSQLFKYLRWRSASAALLLALICALVSCLRLLCDRVSSGEAFSDASVRLLRRFAWCCFGYTAAAALFTGVLDHWIGEALRRHVTPTGFQTSFAPARFGGGLNFSIPGTHFQLDVTTLALGLFALVLSEVFRQGVILREDSELTV